MVDKFIGWNLLIVMLLSSCNIPSIDLEQVAGTDAPPQSSEPEAPTAEPSPTPRSIDITQKPLYWFAPLPPLSVNEGRPFIGSEDFMSLFEPDAPWQNAAEHIQVFKLYGEWVAYSATNAELRQVVADLNQRGLALAVEAGPLDAPSNCGQGIEGFAGSEEGMLIANRIKSAGGTIHLIALDEPYYYAHIYDGENACRWDSERVAMEVGEYIQLMQSEFPEVVIGDTEPLAGNGDDNAYKAWLDIFHEVNGYHLAFLHMDIDWSRIDWQGEMKAIEDYGNEIGVPVGIIYNGNAIDKTDEDWIGSAGERVKKYELETGGRPAQVLFQSWNDKPDYVLPETGEYTFTQFVKSYFEDKSALDFRRVGAGANLALEKPIKASRQISDNPAWIAVDGDPGTLWSAGGFPPKWVEIDLGSASDVKEFRLIPSQYPEGRTVHNLLVKGPGTGDEYVLLTTFDGETKDGDPLVFVPDLPVTGIQFVKIETTKSPSWVAWREITVIAAGE